MKQVVQNVRSGETSVRLVPDPVAGAGQLVIANVRTFISAGTERYVVDLAKKSLLAKARERPDHVRRVVQKLRQEGLLQTYTQVRAKLEEPMPLGYSTAGIVIACGRGIQEFKPGDRVAAAAPHAGVVAVGRNLCARIPDGVDFESASATSIAAIALEGTRLARVTLGERILVIGLGLIGQMAVCMLKAQGCAVFGTDLDPSRLELAKSLGADHVGAASSRTDILSFTSGRGVDAVLICAATSSAQPLELAADVTRTRGRIVLVGVVGMEIPRQPFFEKELEFTVSSSLGPGRSDPAYEERGVDYPFGHVRWTAQRNMEAVLDLMQAGKLPIGRLVTHRFSIDRAPEAYALITSASEPFLGIVLEHDEPTAPRRRVELKRSARPAGRVGLSLVGAGNFARLIMMPLLSRENRGVELRGLCSARGLNAVVSGDRLGFAYASTDTQELLHDDRTTAVMIFTRHDQHAELVCRALRAGKHVFVEKPLCIRSDELAEIEACVTDLGRDCPILMVGYNRRFAPATRSLRDHFGATVPLSISFRFAPGELPVNAWPHDEDVGGGRLVGEACHAIDTCTAIAQSPPVRVYAESAHMVGGVATTDDRVFITVRHANGCISSISYQAGGDRGGPVERIEVFGGGRTVVIDEWDRLLSWDGSGREHSASAGKDKGHAAEVTRFLAACHNGEAWPIPWEQLRGVAWASLAAVQSLREGCPVTND
jgi:predicted dehydrogenase